jgi:lipoyl(octanoyl) transferase
MLSAFLNNEYMTHSNAFHIQYLGLCDYYPTLQAMQHFTAQRTTDTPDEIWIVEHPPTYTLGQNAKLTDILHQGNIPIIQTDRGGQVTYHGPGQLVIYPLLRLARLKCNIRTLVSALEGTVIQLLADYGIQAHSKREAPGVYVQSAKIASVGLRIKNGCSYHGIALNINMDLEPFSRINPCGFPNLAVTQLVDHGGPQDLKTVAQLFLEHWRQQSFYQITLHEPNA